jgi:hypothetical protein
MNVAALLNMWPTGHPTHVEYVRRVPGFDWLNAGLDRLNDETPPNMPLMSVARDTFQSPNGWFNNEALLNMRLMLVTDDTSQSPNGWLNVVALLNV